MNTEVKDNTTAHPAAEYDEKVRRIIPFYELFQSEAINLVRAIHPDPACWVDTGCGTGILVKLAMASFPRTSFILADPSDAMLRQARARLGEDVPGRLTILPATDSAGLGSKLRPGTVDVVSAIQCHHYLQPEGRRQAVQTCFDLLTAGGLFVAFENVAPVTSEGTRTGLKRWKSFQMGQGRPEHEAEKHLTRYGTEFFPITAEQHLELLGQVGFRVVELFWFSQMQAGFYGIK